MAFTASIETIDEAKTVAYDKAKKKYDIAVEAIDAKFAELESFYGSPGTDLTTEWGAKRVAIDKLKAQVKAEFEAVKPKVTIA